MPESWPALIPRGDRRARRQALRRCRQGRAAPARSTARSPDADLDAMIEEAYAGFRHPAVCPLTQLDDNLFVLELFHGPTLAFKDVAMQLLGRLMDHVLRARGARATIVGATSGDTGSAAVEAFRGLDQVDVFILFPHGRVSEVQRRQMTTRRRRERPRASRSRAPSTIARTSSKACSSTRDFATRCACRASTRSIGPASPRRSVYYFTAAVALGEPAPADLLRGADRQFRRHPGRLGRQAHGPADRAPDDRHQRQRHPGPHPGAGALRGAGRAAHHLALDGHPDLVEFRAAAVRGAWARSPRAVRGLMAGLKQSRALHPRPRRAREHPPEFDAARGREAERAGEIGRT